MSEWMSRLMAAAALAIASPAVAQDAVDRADPALVEDELPDQSIARKPDRVSVVAPQPSTSSQLQSAIVVGAIRIDDGGELPPAAFASVIDAYVGRSLSPTALRALATNIAEVARSRGFGLATAWIPQQQVVNGVLTVRLDEGRVDEVRAEGPGAAMAERYLAPLAGRPVRTAALERQLLLAADAAGLWVGRARLERANGRNILLVSTRRQAVEGRAAIDNWGSSSIGPVRAHLAVDFNGVIDRADQISIGGAFTPFDPDEFFLVRGEYTAPIGVDGWTVRAGAYYGHSEPSRSSRDYRGRSWEVSAGVDHALVRARRTSAWAYLTFAVRDSEARAGDLPIRNDRLATVTASTYGYTRLGEGRLRGRLSLVQGLNLLGATGADNPLASRDDGSARFTKAEASTSYDLPIGKRVALSLEAKGQLASQPLLSSEEMGLGGRRFLRGYDYREFSGDKGLAASAELRFEVGEVGPFEDAELYAYGDAGSVGNYDDGRGSGSLASAGGGLRLDVGKLQAGIELGIPLADGFAGRDRDPRLSFTVGARF